jgi:hypothetical protein
MERLQDRLKMSQPSLDIRNYITYSMMLILWSFQAHVVAAEVMVMPRSCSCTIQSIVAVKNERDTAV